MISDFTNTKDDYIKSIRNKVSSRLRVDGLDFLREHNVDNYYDEDNNEIIKLKFDNLYATTDKVKHKDIFGPSRWRDTDAYIFYNVTKDAWSFGVDVLKNDKETFTMDVDLDVNRLKTMDKYIFDIEVAKLKDEEDLAKYSKMFPVGSIAKEDTTRSYWEYYYLITSPVRRIDYGVFKCGIKIINEDGTVREDEKEYPCNQMIPSSMSAVCDKYKETSEENLASVKRKISDAQSDYKKYSIFLEECRHIIDNSDSLIEEAENGITDFINSFNKNLTDAINTNK